MKKEKHEKLIFDLGRKPDMTTVVMYPAIYNDVLNAIQSKIDDDIDCIVVNDGMGLVFGSPVANRLKLPLIIARKEGKITCPHVGKRFHHEAAGDQLIELRTESIPYKKKVVIIDDMIATGHTITALRDLVEEHGAYVSKILIAFGYTAYGYEDYLGHTPVEVVETYEFP